MNRDVEGELAAAQGELAAAQDRIRELEAALAERQRLIEKARQDARNARLEAHSDPLLTDLLNLKGIKLVVDYYCNPEDLSSQGTKSACFLINHIKDKCHDAQLPAVRPTEHRHGQNEGKGLLFAFDLNNLKEINDRYGHAAGDAYLLAFSEILKNFFRCSDFIAHARTGGDEFVAFLTNTNLEDFKSRLDKLYKQLEHIEFTYVNNETGMKIPLAGSCAVGWTEICQSSEDSYERAHLRADRRMYENKNNKKKKGSFLSRDFAGATVWLNVEVNRPALPRAQSEIVIPPVLGGTQHFTYDDVNPPQLL